MQLVSANCRFAEVIHISICSRSCSASFSEVRLTFSSLFARAVSALSSLMRADASSRVQPAAPSAGGATGFGCGCLASLCSRSVSCKRRATASTSHSSPASMSASACRSSASRSLREASQAACRVASSWG